MLLLSSPMIHGCGSGTAGAGEPPVAAVVTDLAPIRCPKTSAAQRAAFRKKVAAPQPDKPDGVSRRVLLAKADELRLALHRAQAMGNQVADELDRCAGSSDGSGAQARTGTLDASGAQARTGGSEPARRVASR